jgi:spoIIIJ-associated protein
MIKEIIAAGKDVLEAKENARIALGAGPLDDVNFEIVHAGSRGIFGIIGVKPAQVKAWIELPDTQERKHRAPRPERTENKPEGEKNQENVNNCGQQKSEHRKNNKKKKKPQNKPQPQKKVEPKAPKTQAIPEEELKMELRTVEAGEDMSFDFVSTLISDIGLKAEAKLYAVEDGTRRITIEGEDAAVLIGHHGDTLDALQYLANLASARKNSKGERDKSRVTIDIEGYRKKREETLRALARRMANKAKRNRRSVMLEPMSAYERRIIHSEIQNIEGVSTNSIGSDNNRKIVIFLTDKKPEGIFEEKAPETPLVEEFAKDEMDNSSEILGNLDVYTTADEIETDVTAVEATRAAEDIFEDDDFDVK